MSINYLRYGELEQFLLFRLCAQHEGLIAQHRLVVRLLVNLDRANSLAVFQFLGSQEQLVGRHTELVLILLAFSDLRHFHGVANRIQLRLVSP